jgi:hypothetical protein
MNLESATLLSRPIRVLSRDAGRNEQHRQGKVRPARMQGNRTRRPGARSEQHGIEAGIGEHRQEQQRGHAHAREGGADGGEQERPSEQHRDQPKRGDQHAKGEYRLQRKAGVGRVGVECDERQQPQSDPEQEGHEDGLAA